jgi:hypothetical protein
MENLFVGIPSPHGGGGRGFLLFDPAAEVWLTPGDVQQGGSPQQQDSLPETSGEIVGHSVFSFA